MIFASSIVITQNTKLTNKNCSVINNENVSLCMVVTHIDKLLYI